MPHLLRSARRALLLLAVLFHPAAVPPAAAQASRARPARAVAVRTGLEVFLAKPPAVVRGKRIGLITNHSGMDRQRRSTVDLLHALPGMTLTTLFSPEHGIRGVEDAAVASTTDEKTGLPIHSLYGATQKPTPEMLRDVDVLVFDIQDIGVRQYTYESTMALAMQAAAEKGIPIVVLDRPNPVTGTIVEGNILEPAFQTFVGIYPVASRHGMTIGELARMYNDRQKIGAKLTVVPMQGWRRALWWDQLDLPWVNPSPNIRRFEAEIHYPGTVFFEAMNLSEGRGTDLPFEQTGAPWLDNQQVVARMNALRLPGVRFEARDIPVAATGRQYPGQTIRGVRFIVTDRARYRPIAASLHMIAIIRQLHPTEFQWRGPNAREPGLLTVDRHGGSAKLKAAIDGGTLPALLKAWDRDVAEFRRIRAPYLLYR